MSSNLRNYVKAAYAMDAIVQRVDPGQWDNPSPCSEWTAREVLGHVIWHTKRLAAQCTGGPPPAEQPESEVAGSDPVRAWSAAQEALLEALDQEGALQTPTDGPFGSSTIDDSLALSTFDAMTHAWDIAKATHQNPVIPADLAQRAYDMVRGAGEAVRSPGILGPEMDAPDDADIVTRYMALAGRQV